MSTGKQQSMKPIFNKIQELQGVAQFSKHEQLVRGLINAIEEEDLVLGSMLPSVNSMVKEFGYSSKTIVKAYKELIDRGLVESKKRHGYFVVNEDIEQTTRLALLIYAFHPIQEAFYNSFRAAVGENVQIDVFFHHSNIEILETILGKIKGQYSLYVIAPIPDHRMPSLIEDIPRNRLLIVDRYLSLDGDFSHVTQEFEEATFGALSKLLTTIQRFDEMTLYFRPDADHPVGIERAFNRFLKQYGLKGQVLQNYTPGSLEKGTVHFTISDGDLWGILKDCKAQHIEVGKDIGILSNSNDQVKEIICGGITTNSIDFELMGRQAADFVRNRKKVQITIPTVLIKRKSL